METGTKVYVQYRGNQYYAEVTGYEFPLLCSRIIKRS